MSEIKIVNARKHNLKNLTFSFPKNAVIGMTGVSGSGKSSLAIDTIYAEGQRRYMESLSTYAKQFFKQVESADVGRIQNLCPAIAVTGQAGGFTSRSTVGTMTEVDDFLRLVYAKISDIRCEGCNAVIKKHSLDEVEEEILKSYENRKILVGAGIKDLAGGKTVDKEILELSGFKKIYSDGVLKDVDDADGEDVNREDAVAVFDRILVDLPHRSRIFQVLETARRSLKNKIVQVIDEKGGRRLFSMENICPHCRREYQLPDIQLFSFNSPLGACPECSGFGRVISMDESKVIPDDNLTLAENAVKPFSKGAFRWWQYKMNYCAKMNGIPLDVPYRSLSEEHKRLVWKGDKKYKGIEGFFKKLQRKRYKVQNRVLLARYRRYDVCGACQGSRLKKESGNYIVGGKTLSELQSLHLSRLLEFFSSLGLTAFQRSVVGHVVQELTSRLEFLNNVGLHYLHLSRLSSTLSCGELRRIQLAQGMGKMLCDILFILDEPTVGLHVNDSQKLVGAVKALKKLGNTILVIEHDRSVIRECDHVIDLGPLSGAHGGKILYQGDYSGLLECQDSLTGLYFSGKKKLSVNRKKIKLSAGGGIIIREAGENNLKGITVRIPPGVITAVTGVSGAGKSTLVREVLHKTYQKMIRKEMVLPGKVKAVEGLEGIEEMYFIDQNRIAATPKGNVATFTGAMDKIRKVFASCEEAKRMKMTSGHFSFNSDKGRCPQCKGIGYETIDMQFLTDVTVPCKYCHGDRYQSDVLKIRFRGKGIHEVLRLTVEEAGVFFQEEDISIRELEWLKLFGLGYICLGQTLNTLSAGESQRLKLSDTVSTSKKKDGNVYIFDEPSVGLHMNDIHYILECLYRLRDDGNTVIVVEHNMDIIRNADFIIDLGPEGGEAGGYIVAQGTPEEVAAQKKSYTGKALSAYF
jgi:excinuclease ABC subunit A